MTDAKDVHDTLKAIAFMVRWSPDGGQVIGNDALKDILNHISTLTRERDEAVKRRREIDDEAFDYAEQIETLRTHLAAARVLLKSVPSALNAAFSAGAEERENGSDRRQEKQMETVYAMRKAITAALTQGDA